MAKFKIPFECICTVYVTIEAETKEGAIEEAENNPPRVQGFVGNCGIDKLIGVSGKNESIEAGEIDCAIADDVIKIED